jgi:transposase
MKKLYTVQLDEPTRDRLKQMLNSGVWPARKLKHARILVLADTSQAQTALNDAQIAEKVGCGRNTVQRVRHSFALDGIEAALSDKARSGPSRRMLDTKAEQHLVAIACTTPPNGAERWTLELLVQAAINHKIVASVSDETIRRVLLRHDLKPWPRKNVVYCSVEC